MKKYFTASLMIFLIIPSVIYAASAEVGMITQVSGNVSYQSVLDNKPASVRNFMKVHDEDSFSLAADSVLQVVYFGNGRKETWKGPGNFKAGKTQGQGAIQPAVSAMESKVSGEIVRLANIVDSSRLQRTGSTLVRGDKPPTEPSQNKQPALTEPEQKEIADAKKTYQGLLKDADAKDITPELYMFSVFADYDQYSDMKSLIAEMRKKQPTNKEIDRLEEWMSKQ